MPSLTIDNNGQREQNPHVRGRPRLFDRERALDAAMELFWKQGYMQTSMEDLCKAMGIRSASIYCAFGNKSALFIKTLGHYRKKYWEEPLKRFAAESDPNKAFIGLFEDAAKIYLRPGAPCGCFATVSTMSLPAAETRIAGILATMEDGAKRLFRDKLMVAANTGFIPPDCDIPSIAGALTTFIKGLSLMARRDICQSELIGIARQGRLLLPVNQVLANAPSAEPE